jgi:hypothetical protein
LEKSARSLLKSELPITDAARSILESCLIDKNVVVKLNLDHVYEIKDMVFDIMGAPSAEAINVILNRTEFLMMTEEEHKAKTYG